MEGVVKVSDRFVLFRLSVFINRGDGSTVLISLLVLTFGTSTVPVGSWLGVVDLLLVGWLR